MKKIITIILILLPVNLFAQSNDELIKLNNDTNLSIHYNLLSNIDSDFYKSRITSGIGFTYLSGSRKSVRFLFSLYTYINMRFLTKHLYLGLGTDIFPEPKYGLKTVNFYNFIPTIGINLLKNKISLFLGEGLCLYPSMIIGSIFLFKADYNINNKIAIGFDIKRPYFGDQEFRDQTLLLNHINFSFKF